MFKKWNVAITFKDSKKKKKCVMDLEDNNRDSL